MQPKATGRVIGRQTASPGRVKAFRIIAWIMAASAVAFGLFTAVFAIVGEEQEIHAFHNVAVATLLLVLSAPPAIAAARAPERAAGPLLHLVVLGVAGLGTMALALMIDIFTFPFIVFVVVLLMLRVPRERAIGSGPPSVWLAVLVALAAVPLIAYALGHAALQRVDASSPHAEFNHWVEMAFVAAAIPLLGALAAVRPAAFRMSAWTAGVALTIMGAASLLLQRYASAFDAPWAWASLAGGLIFLVVAEWEARRAGPLPGGGRAFRTRQSAG